MFVKQYSYRRFQIDLSKSISGYSACLTDERTGEVYLLADYQTQEQCERAVKRHIDQIRNYEGEQGKDTDYSKGVSLKLGKTN